MKRSALWFVPFAVFGCGDNGTGPIEVPYGVTTFVVLMNPVVNDANQATVPAPGTTRASVNVSVAGGPSGITDASGVVVLTDVAPGNKTIAVSGGGASGQVSASIADQDLREVAIAMSGNTAEIMANVQYAFGGAVVELDPSMSLTQVNNALSQSNTIVFFAAGTYTGDLQFSGSNVTLYGEGDQGGQVTITGNVTVAGSGNRMRGARINGNLSIPGSNFGMSFSRVTGTTNIAGSSGTLLNNRFCGAVTISGSGTRALGNAGLAPMTPVPATGC